MRDKDDATKDNDGKWKMLAQWMINDELASERKYFKQICGGRLRDLAVARWTTYRYHPCSNLGVGTSLTSLRYLRRSLGPFSLPCAQRWS